METQTQTDVLFRLPKGKIIDLRKKDKDKERKKGYGLSARIQLTQAGEAERWFSIYRMPAEVLKKSAKKFEDTSIFMHTEAQHIPPAYYSMKDKVGFVDNVSYNAQTKTLDGDLHLLDTPSADQARGLLETMFQSGDYHLTEFSSVFSADTDLTVRTRKDGEEELVETVKNITHVFSTDFVDEGAFPMRAIKKLGKYEFQTQEDEKVFFHSLSKEKSMSQETTVDTNVVTLDKFNKAKEAHEAEIAELKKQLAEKGNNEGVQKLSEQVAEMAQKQIAQARLAYYNSKLNGLDVTHPSIVALHEDENFKPEELTEAQIDAVMDPLTAAITAAGRAKAVIPNARVTVDSNDKVKALTQSILLEKPIKLGDVEYQAHDIMKLAKDSGEAELAFDPNVLWAALGLASIAIGEGLETGQNMDEIKALQIQTTGSNWATTVIETIIQAVPMLYNESKFVTDISRLIPQRNRHSVPDYHNRFIDVQGNYSEPGAVAEGALIPDATTPEGFRAPLKPTKYPFIEKLTKEAFLNGPTVAIRAVPRRMAEANSRNIYEKVMQNIFGVKDIAGAGYAMTKASVYESSSLDTKVDLYSGSGDVPNLITTTATDANAPTLTTFVNYDRVLALMNKMLGYSMYGESDAQMAGINQPKFLVVPAPLYFTAEALVQSQDQPGKQNREANLTRMLTVIPANLAAVYSGTAPASYRAAMAVLADPAAIIGLYASYLNNQQSPSATPDPSREAMFTRDVIRFRNDFTFHVGALDRRGFVLHWLKQSAD